MYNTYVATRTVGQARWRSPVTHSLCGHCALVQHNMRLAGHVHSDCITRGNALPPSCLAFLSSKISEANLHCWLRLICCRWASLSSTVSDANLGIYCWLRLICCRQTSLSSANHSLKLSARLASCMWQQWRLGDSPYVLAHSNPLKTVTMIWNVPNPSFSTASSTV